MKRAALLLVVLGALGGLAVLEAQPEDAFATRASVTARAPDASQATGAQRPLGEPAASLPTAPTSEPVGALADTTSAPTVALEPDPPADDSAPPPIRFPIRRSLRSTPCVCPPPPPPPPPVLGESSCGGVYAENGTLVWLKRHQRPDGSFGGPRANAECVDCCLGPTHGYCEPDAAVSRTALCMLTFVGQGNTHRFGRQKRAVRYALKWLKARQDEQGSLASSALRPEARAREQSLGALAMCELFAMTRDFTLRRRAQQALDRAIEWHLPLLGARPHDDMWLVETLIAASSAKTLKLPPQVWHHVRSRLPLHTSGELTHDALTLLAHREHRATKAWRSAFAQLWTRVVDGALVTADLDAWRHVTRLLFARGGREWDRYRRELNQALSPLYADRGCLTGTLDSVLSSSLGRDRMTATNLAASMLELHYRTERAQQD